MIICIYIELTLVSNPLSCFVLTINKFKVIPETRRAH